MSRIIGLAVGMCVLWGQAAQATPITYWNVFNIEDETSQQAQLVTYSSLMDMLLDQNRLGVFTPDGPGLSENTSSGPTPTAPHTGTSSTSRTKPVSKHSS